MAKNEKRTMNVILDDLNNTVKAHNELDLGNVTRTTLLKNANDLVKEYNELSMLTLYAECADAALPVKAFVEAGVYKTKKLKRNEEKVPDKDGVLHLVISYTVEDSTGDLDLTKFLEWAAAMGKKDTNTTDWRIKMAAVKDAIKKSYRQTLNSNAESNTISVKALKTLIQDMFDALIFIPTEKGENSVVATNSIAKIFREFATQTNTKLADSENIGSILTGKVWNTLVMKNLKSAVTGKKLIVTFDVDEAVTEATEAAAE